MTFLFQTIQLLFLCWTPLSVRGFAPPRLVVGGRTRRTTDCASPTSSTTSPTRLWQDRDNVNEETLEALQSLADFHDGTWQGQARSFGVTADVAAGIVQRETSSPFTVSCKLGLDVENRDFTMTETWTWGSSSSDEDSKISSRQVSLQSSQCDVDAVDGSFSLDQTLPNLPADIVGTTKLAQFGIEHCLAVSDNCRTRCWALYGVDGNLIRVVVSQEVRQEQQEQSTTTSSQADDSSAAGLTAADLLEMQSDVDRLVDKLTGNGATTPDGASSSSSPQVRLEQLNRRLSDNNNNNNSNEQGDIDLTLHPATLLEMSSGVWLGDVIIRDHPQVPSTREVRGQGFGKQTSGGDEGVSTRRPRFAEWSVGVQKIAWRWMWNFGPEIRQVNDVGKAMGAALMPDIVDTSLPGTVHVNEGLSRRIPKDERMVYIDWNGGNDVGFLVESFAIQVPRYLTFDRRGRPFVTEFTVFQSAPPSEDDNDDGDKESIAGLPKLVCSKSSRIYNFEGLLKQGCTSFFTFKRFGESKE